MNICRVALALAALPLTVAHAATPHWVRSWAASPMEQPAPPAVAPTANAPAPIGSNVTFRMVARVSAGGHMLRLRLSNELGKEALPLGAVHVALASPDGSIRPGSDRTVSFAGAGGPTLAPGAPILSDPVAMDVPDFGDVVVSIHVPGDAAQVTVHPLGSATTQIIAGDRTDATAPATPPTRTTTLRYILSAIDVAGGGAQGTIATIGDSITDGARSTPDTNNRWPDIFARRLGAHPRFAVANAGISGNRLLLTGAGPAALARLDRDVFSAPNIRYLIVLEGINDIGTAARANRPAPAPALLIAAYRQIIDRAHDAGVKVIGATITPYKGAGYYAPDGEATRKAVNDWIRAPGHFDGVVDFASAVADPADPASIAAAFDSGDKLHPGDAGYRRMGEAIDLKLFR